MNPTLGTMPFEVLAYAVYWPGISVGEVAWQLQTSENAVRTHAKKLTKLRLVTFGDSEIYPTSSGTRWHLRQTEAKAPAC